MKRCMLVLACLLMPVATGNDTIRGVRLPEVAPEAEIKEVPLPVPVTQLAAEAWYVIESDSPLIVLASPPGLVSITFESGPIRMRGRFADGKDVESRYYTGAHLYTVEAVAAGEVELLIVPQSATSAEDVIRRTLRVMGLGPMPPPLPVPDPDVQPTPIPEPQPEPLPDATTGPIKVLIIEETADRGSLPASQIAILTGAKLREYAAAKCAKSDGRNPDFRVLDADQDVSAADTWIQQAFAQPRTTLPFLLVSNGKRGWGGPLPTTEDETIEILSRYGGKL